MDPVTSMARVRTHHCRALPLFPCTDGSYLPPPDPTFPETSTVSKDSANSEHGELETGL